MGCRMPKCSALINLIVIDSLYIFQLKIALIGCRMAHGLRQLQNMVVRFNNMLSAER